MVAENESLDRDSLICQLQQFNERSRWYSSRLWQEPFTFLALLALVLPKILDKTDNIKGNAFFFLSILGVLFAYHMHLLELAEKGAVKNINKVERLLQLDSKAQERKITLPALVAVLLATIMCLILGFAYLWTV